MTTTQSKIIKHKYENVADFKYFRITVTNQNYIHYKVKNLLNLGNASLHSVQNLLPSHHLSKNLKIKYMKLEFNLFHVGGNLVTYLQGIPVTQAEGV
jgi:hypothetical protein